jgi:hypothetical protein
MSSSTDAKPDAAAAGGPKSTPPPARRPSADKPSPAAAAARSSPNDATSDNGQAELTTAIDQLLDAVGSKFKAMSKDIMTQSAGQSQYLVRSRERR